MNRNQFYRYLADRSGHTIKDSKYMTDLVLDTIIKFVCKHGELTLHSFGNFSVYIMDSFARKNPKTGKVEVMMPKQYIKFKMGKKFRDALYETSITIRNGEIEKWR